MLTHLAFSHAQLTRQLQDVTSEVPALLLDLGRNSSSLGTIVLNKAFVLVESLLRSCDELICHLTPTDRVIIFLARFLSVGRDGRIPDVDPWTVERDSCGCRWQTIEELTHRLVELSGAAYTFIRIVTETMAMLTPVLAYVKYIFFLM